MEIKDTIENLGRAFEEFKSANDQRLAQVEKSGFADPAVVEKLEKLSARITQLDELKNDIEKIQTKQNRPDFGGSKANGQHEQHKELFANWMRRRDHESSAELRRFETEMRKKGVFTTGSGGDSAGGYAIPEIIATDILANLIDISPVRQVARVVTAGSPDYKQLVDVRGATTGWVGEKGTRSETDTPALEEVAPTFGTLYARPTATEESLNDIFFDVGAWLTESITEEMGKAEGVAFISGDGTNKPTGFLAGVPVSTGDASRAFGTLQYVATGNASGFGSLALTSPTNFPADVFIDTAYSLKAGYRQNSVWMMNKNTLAEVRKLKDSEGNYIWRPGLDAGAPSTILGYNVVEAEDMPGLGVNAFPVAFGDFGAGYLIVDLVGMRVTIDDNITAPGYIKWYVRRRLGGKVLKSEAIKLIKCAVS
jgi:HK97 family phage major capsid protein